MKRNPIGCLLAYLTPNSNFEGASKTTIIGLVLITVVLPVVLLVCSGCLLDTQVEKAFTIAGRGNTSVVILGFPEEPLVDLTGRQVELDGYRTIASARRLVNEQKIIGYRSIQR